MIGPGRGPIMREIIKACEDLNYENYEKNAIEKNENSIPTLLNYIQENEKKLKGRVKIIHQDIRNVVLEEKADILVSEMLGSFGDNELSPELIVAAERLFLKYCFDSFFNKISYLL